MLREKLISERKNIMRESLKRLAEELLREKKRFVIWGCGNTGRTAEVLLRDYSNGELAPEYIVDNNKSRWQEDNIKSPAAFELEKESIDVVLVCVYVADQVIDQLREMNYQGRIIPVASSVIQISEDTIDYYDARMDLLETMYGMLADERSKKTVETFLNVMRSGDISLWEQVNGDSRYKLIDPEILTHDGQHYFVDIGAFTGDTLRGFLELNHYNYRSIICMEPDRNNYLVLQEYARQEKLDRTFLLNMAAGKENGISGFSANRSESCHLWAEGEEKVRVAALDELPEAAEVSMLKVSTNGFDLDALMGAENLIRRCKPQIATYASGELLWRIPLFLKKIVPDYKIYCRHYGIGCQAMICYARR